jgi:TolA-binding protein
MSMRGGLRAIVGVLVAGLVIAPAWAHGRQLLHQVTRNEQEPSQLRAEERDQDAHDREQERKDREQEKKDREQERVDRMQEFYDEGREALDEDRYQKAEEKFTELARLNGPQTDAALYWKAYAENRSGKRDTALTTIADLKKRFPQSWKSKSTSPPATPSIRNRRPMKS